MIKGLQTLAKDLYNAYHDGKKTFRRGYSNGYTAVICFGVGSLWYYDAKLLQITHDKIIINDSRWRGYSQSTTQALNTLKEIFSNAVIE